MRTLNVLAAMVVFSFFHATARADRPAVEKVMAEMTRAVLAGDVEGYIKHVAIGDAIFLQEQKMWAKDLLTHTPAEFALSIVDEMPAPKTDEPKEGSAEAKPATVPVASDFGDKAATFTLRMAWKMKEEKATERTVQYPVRFTKGVTAWVYEGEDWNHLDRAATEEDAANRVLFAEGLNKTAETVAEALPAVRRKVDAIFANPSKQLLTVKLYTSMRHLQASIYLSYVNGLSGWNEPDESIKILAQRNNTAAGLRPLLSHEYGHCASFLLGPKINSAPWWVLEGIAEFSSSSWRENPASNSTRRMVAWSRSDRLAAWEDLVDFRTVPLKLHGNIYTQGEHMMHYITEQYGDAKRNAWLTSMAQGASLDEASKAALAVSFADLDSAWRAHVKALVEADDRKKSEEEAK
ncbi:MAG: hypothetical protein ACT4PL_00980 [Phycisphaerales bacterium]